MRCAIGIGGHWGIPGGPGPHAAPRPSGGPDVRARGSGRGDQLEARAPLSRPASPTSPPPERAALRRQTWAPAGGFIAGRQDASRIMPSQTSGSKETMPVLVHFKSVKPQRGDKGLQ